MLLQMESEIKGAGQFMYCAGQLTVESNVFWDLDFKGYHGLGSVNDIPKLSMIHVCSPSLTRCELDHYYSLMKHVCPLVKDPICFQLLSMIMLLDTSSLIENDAVPLDAIGTSNCPNYPPEVNSSPCSYVVEVKKPRIEERFQEIESLQRHYINLLRKRCMKLDNTKLKLLGDTDVGLKRTMHCVKQLAEYVPFLK